MPLRICLLSGEYPPQVGGVADYTRCLAQALHGLGHRVLVLTNVGRGIEEEGWEVRRAISRWDSRQVFAALGDERWDVFHFQYVPHLYGRGGVCPSAALLPLMLRRRGRVVTTLHELYRPWSRRVTSGVAAAIQRLQLLLLCGSHRLVVTTMPRLRLLGRLVPWCAVDLVPVGATIEPVVGDGQVSVIRSTLVPEDTFVVGSFGAHFVGHDLVTLLKAVARVPTVVLVLLGDVTHSVREMTKEVGEALLVSERLRYTGYLPPAVLSQYLTMLDGYVHMQDVGATPRSTALATALAHGLAVIAQYGSDTDARYRDGGNMLLVPPHDVWALTAALVRLQDRGLRSVLQEGAHLLYGEAQSWSVIAQAFLALYQPIMG